MCFELFFVRFVCFLIARKAVLNNWHLVWKYRNESIFQDAEKLKTTGKIIVSIGGKILNKKKVKYQYMGLMFIPKKKKTKNY